MNNREKQEHSAVETAQTDTQTAQEILDNGKPVRVQCAFVDESEIMAVSEFIAKQQGYDGPYKLPEPVSKDG